jgi:hypothetical protein
MPNSPDRDGAQVLSLTGELVTPTPRRKRAIDLSTVRDVRRENAALYRDARDGLISTGDASRLCFILVSLARMIESETFEARLSALESKHADQSRH